MSFITENFLLDTKEAATLYHDHASDLPIIDYHNHLSPKELVNDTCFGNITQAWLSGDHYKWRAMRTLGVTENFITGKATDREKFAIWAKISPYTMRNPLYHWTHLELKRYFDIDELLSEKTADHIYDLTTERLQQPTHGPRKLLEMMEVELICTTDDPMDSLEHHENFAKAESNIKMYPTFRPDKVYAIGNPTSYKNYVEHLGARCGLKSIDTYGELLGALENRIAFFHSNGCRVADHGLEYINYFEEPPYDIETLFSSVIKGKVPTTEEVHYFQYQTLVHLGRIYHQKGWVQQFHLGALRNSNTRMYNRLGPDSGYDSIGDFPQAKGLAKFLGVLDSTDQLAKTILYNLNPAWNEVFATMAGNFNGDGIKGKIQFGAGWWYNDQLDGMEKQINSLSNMGILSCFVGMLTDSRSLLSYPRHEYFRRLLCNLLGWDIKKGLLPRDFDHIGEIVQDICYNNAKEYFNFKK